MEPCVSCVNIVASCCDKYNLKEGKYYKNVHSLPWWDVGDIATDEKESFAVIADWKHEEKIYIFTESGGFEELPTSTSNRSNVNTARRFKRESVLLRLK